MTLHICSICRTDLTLMYKPYARVDKLHPQVSILILKEKNTQKIMKVFNFSAKLHECNSSHICCCLIKYVNELSSYSLKLLWNVKAPVSSVLSFIFFIMYSVLFLAPNWEIHTDQKRSSCRWATNDLGLKIYAKRCGLWFRVLGLGLMV